MKGSSNVTCGAAFPPSTECDGAACVPKQDLAYYTRMFAEDMRRDPTNVELFDIAQSNSEHRCQSSFISTLLLSMDPAAVFAPPMS